MLNPLSELKHPVLIKALPQISRSLLVLAFGFYFIPSFSFAQIYSSSSTAGTGGAGRAGVEIGDANYLNPASLVHMQGGHFFSDFAKNDLVVGLSESSRDILFPASFAYRQRSFLDPVSQQQVKMSESRLSVADFVVDRFSMGLTGVINRQVMSDTGTAYDQTNGDLGFFFTPNDHFGTALVGYNILGSLSEETPEELRLQREVALGMNYIYEKFLRARIDLVSSPNMNFGRPVWMGGVESMLSKFMVARFGFQDDVLNDRLLDTFGFGFNGPKFALNYAFMGSVNSKEISRHSVDLLLTF